MFRWLTQKRNRRFVERAYMLDVKLRTRQMRAARWRAAGVGLGGLAALGLFVLLFWRGGEWLLNYAAYDNATFAIQRIEVSSDGVISPAVIRRWAMVKPGENLLALDLMRVKRDLELQPPIAFVAVERILPGTLRLFITERQPVAQTIALQPRRGGGVSHVIYDFDPDGYVLQPPDPAWRMTPAPTNETLPLLTGVPLVELQPGRQVELSQIRAALRLLSDLDHSPMAGMVELQSINVAAPEILEATTSQGAQITFSLDQFDLQLRRWREISDQYRQWGKAITSLDLSVSNNLPVRWMAAGGMPPLPHQTAKPVKTKRKNV
jgi:cell division septal protein FtsQ